MTIMMQSALERACLTVSRLIKEHIRASFRIDPELLRHLDRIVALHEQSPGYLAEALYGIEPADNPHEYHPATDDWGREYCVFCGRTKPGHDAKQAEVCATLGVETPDEIRRRMG